MAPYIPQNAHYAHLDVCEHLPEDLYAFVGKGGHRFYRLTRELGLRYIWFNPETKVIELWGPYESFRDRDPVTVVRTELNKFVSQLDTRYEIVTDVQTTKDAPPDSSSQCAHPPEQPGRDSAWVKSPCVTC